MKQTYRLIKMRAETAQDLKRSKTQMGKSGFDDLFASMIRLTDKHLLEMKNVEPFMTERNQPEKQQERAGLDELFD